MMKNSKSEYIVEKENTLLNYLIEELKYSNSEAKRLLSFKDIYINDKNISKYDYKLKINDKVVISKVIINKNNICPLEIIYEDQDFIAVNKPAGLLSMASEKEKDRTAYHLVADYVNKNKEKIFILHRLDKDTSGVLVFVKNQKLRDMLQQNWNSIVTKRGYYAICQGVFEKKKDRIVNYLKSNRADIVYSVDSSNKYGQQAITAYQVIKEVGDYSLVDVDIFTGRRNQIRVTFNDLNCPIIGDKKYGNSSNPINRLGLHAYHLSFIHPLNNKEYVFQSVMPKEFRKLMK